MKQALQTANLDEGEVQFVAVNDVAEKYTKKNIELHETEFFIPVRSTSRLLASVTDLNYFDDFL